MTVLLSELIDAFDQLWPRDQAESWDAPGLVVGHPGQPVSRILLTVDVTSEILDEAIDGGFDLIVAHHPLLMRGIKFASEDTAKGSILSRAIRANVAIFAAHTNADIVEDGVSDTLAKAFGLKDIKPLVATAKAGEGHGRIGSLENPVSLGDFSRFISKVLPSTALGVRVAGDYDRQIETVALCGGAGDSFIEAAMSSGADVYVTSDLRHHPVQEAIETAAASDREFALIDISHWAAEWLWLDSANRQIHQRFDSLQVITSELRTDPWTFAVTQ